MTGEKSEEPVVYIGSKPVMNYVVACLTCFNAGAKGIQVKARGRSISRAIDSVELLRRAFVKDVEVVGIKIGTEKMERSDRPMSNVSTIEITLMKQ
jgi:DNA-binding protein